MTQPSSPTQLPFPGAPPPAGQLRRTARFSPNRVFRYDLWRGWDDSLPPATFVMLNPSYANEDREDNTVSRCIKFAKRWGCGSLHVANIFAIVSTDPQALYGPNLISIVGPENDAAIVAAASQSKIVVASWGMHGAHLGRAAEVQAMIEPLAPLVCLGLTQGGYPKHPLARGKSFIPYEFEPIPLAEAIAAWKAAQP